MLTTYIVNGYPRAGKDTLIRFMTDVLEQQGVEVHAFSSIDPIRSTIARLGIDTSAKTEADRKLLSVVGDAVEEHSRFRTRLCLGLARELSKPGDKEKALFLHIREPENIQKIADALRAEGIRFFRILVRSPREETRFDNPSDTCVTAYSYDFIAQNSGTLGQLYDEAVSLIDLIQMRKEFRNAG